LSGGFYLTVLNKQSSFIPYDADDETMTQGLESLHLSVYNIYITPSDLSGARSWIITFNVFEDFNQVPLLGSNSTLLHGGVTTVWTEILRQGIHSTLGLSGYFQLEYQGNITSFLSYNATAEEVKEALEALPTIGLVNVTRTGPSFIQGYSWIIEILEVNVFTVRGYQTDPTAYISELIAYNHLIGTDTYIIVEVIQQNTYGNSAGVVYVYQKQLDSFVEVARLRGDDTSVLNQFGYSVSLYEDYLAVGALAAGVQLNTTQDGSVYIFRVFYDCYSNETICSKTNWQQIYQLFPTNRSEVQGYGFNVAITDTFLVVSAPYYQNNTGIVYIYSHAKNNSSSTTYSESWSLLQSVQANDLLPGDFFGFTIAIEFTTLVVSAPYADGGNGRIVIFKYNTKRNFFTLDQLMYPSYQNFQGGLFGFSVDIDTNILVVGAAEQDSSSIYLSRVSQLNVYNAGAAYVYSRLTSTSDFKFFQTLIPSNIRENDRFGYDVSIYKDIIVVGAIEDFTGTLLPNAAIIQVETSANYDGKPLSGTFKLYWNFTNTTESYRYLSTRSIPSGASANLMKTIIEQDLQTGTVLVSRSNMDMYDKGYAWSITFVGAIEAVPLFSADSSDLFGTNATVTVQYLSPNPVALRGNAHVFHKAKDTDGQYIEQLFLSPRNYQLNDRCGWKVRVYGYWALIACPNRDSTTVPNQNSGAGEIYDLSLLNIEFSETSFEVLEGSQLNISIQRSEVNQISQDVLFYISTLDRNSPTSLQQAYKNIYGLSEASIPFPWTVLDYIGVAGKAFARSQHYGSQHNESIWVDGMYDYRAISDYVPVYLPLAYLAEDFNINQIIITSPDKILEVPDENITLAITAPGIWPTILGRLYSNLTIIDLHNGFASLNPLQSSNDTLLLQYDKLYEKSGNPIGESIAVSKLLDQIAAGSPLISSNNISGAGEVFLYYKSSGRWQQSGSITSPNPSLNGNFGDELVINDIPKRNISYLFIGEPGACNTYVFVQSLVTSLDPSWSLDTILTCPPNILPQTTFGSQNTISVSGDILVVGSPSIESIYVYIHKFDPVLFVWNWILTQTLQSSDYTYDLIYGLVTLHNQGFGTSVAISSRTIAVGAPHADYNKLGVDAVEVNWNSEGTDMVGYGRGKAYVFYSVPVVQQVTLLSPGQISTGTFCLEFYENGMLETTSPLSYFIDSIDMQLSLQSLGNIDVVSVTTLQSQNNTPPIFFSWMITFISDFNDEVGLLTPIWYDNNCSYCTPFNVGNITITTKIVQNSTEFFEQANLTALDKRNGDRFGSTLALDGNQLMVGAIYSDSISTTTWDFEVF
jgi:hypothetical protein